MGRSDLACDGGGSSNQSMAPLVLGWVGLGYRVVDYVMVMTLFVALYLCITFSNIPSSLVLLPLSHNMVGLSL